MVYIETSVEDYFARVNAWADKQLEPKKKEKKGRTLTEKEKEQLRMLAVCEELPTDKYFSAISTSHKHGFTVLNFSKYLQAFAEDNGLTYVANNRGTMLRRRRQ